MPSLVKAFLLLWLAMWSLFGIRLLASSAREGLRPVASTLFGLGLLALAARELLKAGIGRRKIVHLANWRNRQRATKVSVLLLQPEVTYGYLLKRALEEGSSSKHVVLFHNATEMKEYLTSLRQDGRPNPELLFLDGEMPEDQSFALLRWIKSDSELQKVFVVFSISSNYQSIARRAYRDRADACVGKPVEGCAMLSLLRLVEVDWRRCRAAENLIDGRSQPDQLTDKRVKLRK